MAAPAASIGSVHDAGSDGRTCRPRSQDGPACGLDLRSRGRSELQKTVFASEQDRPDVARKRERWKARQASLDPTRLVFIDETWVKPNMTPLRGRGLKGRRLESRAPHGRWKTLTFIAALRCDRIDAPLVIDGPINGESFVPYVEQASQPSKKATSSSSTISLP
jgi:DDE superfamily endonuclease